MSCIGDYTTMAVPDRTHHIPPRLDEYSAIALSEATATLGSLRALSSASPTVPIDPAIPASASSSVNASAVRVMQNPP